MQGVPFFHRLFTLAEAGRWSSSGWLAVLFVAWLIVDGSAMAQPPGSGPSTSTIKSAVALEGALVEAIASAEKSVVAIARVRRLETGEEQDWIRQTRISYPTSMPVGSWWEPMD